MTEIELRLDNPKGKSLGKCTLPDGIAMGIHAGDHVVLPGFPDRWLVLYRLVAPSAPGLFSIKPDVFLTLVVRSP